MYDVIIWGILFVALVVAEVATFQFVSIWLALGALVAMISAAVNVSVPAQIVIFVVVSAMLLILTRPLVRKLSKFKKVPTNADLDIGKNAVVIEAIGGSVHNGRVKLDGVDWTAISDEEIEVGEVVTVTKIDGAKVIVKK